MKSSLRVSSSFTGAPTCLRQQRGNQIGILILVFVAEAAAHVLADDAHFFVGYAQIAGHVMAAIRSALGRRVDRQLVALPAGDADARLHLRVVNVSRGVAVFEHVVGCSKTFFDISAADRLPAWLRSSR